MKFFQECENCKKLTHEGHNGKEHGQFLCDKCFFEVYLEKKFEFKQLKPLTLHPRFNYVVDHDQVNNENWFEKAWERIRAAVVEFVHYLGFNRHGHFHG
jgi:hypothetical protein